MFTVTAHLESISPISFSKQVFVEPLNKEAKDEYEKRTWREKCHYDESGRLYIPPMMLKFAIGSTATYLGSEMQIPGEGKARYTKHLVSGILIMDPILLPITKEEVQGEWYSCHADGKRTCGTRVARCFPVVHRWDGDAIIHIVDEKIKRPIFLKVLEACGQINGLGRFRPQNGGFYGRFKVTDLQWPA